MINESEQRLECEKFQKENLPLLKILVTILSPEDAIKTREIYREHNVNLLFKVLGEGTADSELMDLLGLGSSHKTLTLCITQEEKAESLLEKITKERRLRARGFGIAFILPMSGVAMPIFRLLGPNPNMVEHIEKHIESEVRKLKAESEYELILSVVNPGYSEEVMDAARFVGATGGTVIHARQLGSEMEHVWGITIQGEREIVAIIVRHEEKIAVMKAISEKCGIKTEARGLTIALPVESAAGLES